MVPDDDGGGDLMNRSAMRKSEAVHTASRSPLAPFLLAPLLDRAEDVPDLRRVLWGVTETLEAVARDLRQPVMMLAITAARLGRRALTEDVITIGLLPVEEAAEARGPHPLSQAIGHYAAAFRQNSAGRAARCRASLIACLRALSLAITESEDPQALQTFALWAYALGETRANPPVGAVLS